MTMRVNKHPNHFRHVWRFKSAVIYAPERKSPMIEVVYQCDRPYCRAIHTRQIRPRVPTPTARTDEERFETAADKAETKANKSGGGEGVRPEPEYDVEGTSAAEGPGEAMSFEEQSNLAHNTGIKANP